MPAVLIPTKSFADPVIFCADAPDSDSEDFFVLNAILPYLQEKLNTSVSGKIYLNNCKVTAAEATALIPVVTFTFSSVEKISSCDLLYKEILADFKNSLTNITNSARTLQNVKTKYIAKEFSEAYTNTGSAILIEESLREKNEDSPLFYLEKYRMTQELDAEKILKVIEKYLEFENLFRLYSSDSK